VNTDDVVQNAAVGAAAILEFSLAWRGRSVSRSRMSFAELDFAETQVAVIVGHCRFRTCR